MMLLAVLGVATGLLEFRSSLLVQASPFSDGRVRNVDHLTFRKAMLTRDRSVFEGLHISPRDAPSRVAKHCTYLRWFAWPDKINIEPYYELPLPLTKLRLLRSIFHFRVGAHSLSIEQGGIEMPEVPRHLRRCTFCATNAIGDERDCVFVVVPSLSRPPAAACRNVPGLSWCHEVSHVERNRSPFVLLCWPFSMRRRQQDRFVLIGLCWLY